jgi:hypothetical protein
MKPLGFDGCGSRSALLSYFDDQTAFLPYADLPLVIRTITEHGPPLDIVLNGSKTKILTTPSSHHHSSTLTPERISK